MSGEHGNLKLYSFKPETSSMTVLFNKNLGRVVSFTFFLMYDLIRPCILSYTTIVLLGILLPQNDKF